MRTPPAGLNAAREVVNSILDSISDGVFTVDRDWRISSFNRAAERITGTPRVQALGRKCSDVLRADVCDEACVLRYTLESGSPVVNYTVRLTAADGRQLPVSISTAVLRDAAGQTIGAVETFRGLSTLEELRKELQKSFTFHDMVSKSPRMQQLFEVLPAIAKSDSTVLIEGASGTGKELVARALHDLSSRRRRPFVCVNCGALPEPLLESELFGYQAGAFTGATRNKPGRLVAASGGTVLLDEIGATPLAIQVKLLRVIQERKVEPLGDLRGFDVDLRFVAATNQDLAAEVQRGTFREDLYYRLNVIRLELPPLRERLEDVPLLVDRFVARHSARLGKEISTVSPQAMNLLLRHDYPGNVRELQNAIEHACVLCCGRTIDADQLPDTLRHRSGTPGDDLAIRVAFFERQILEDALRRNRFNRAAAARELGIHKTTLFRKLKQLGIEAPRTAASAKE